MIRHDFECSAGHIFELPVESSTKRVRCQSDGCRRMANRVFLPPRVSRAAQAFQPSVFYQRADGEIFVPGRTEDHLPKKLKNKLGKQGFVERRLSNFREYEQFRKEHTQHLRSKNNTIDSSERERYDRERARSLDQLRHGFDMQREDGTTVHIRAGDFSGFGQAFLSQALQNAEFQDEQSGEFYIDSFENDNPRYNDRDTRFRDRRV